VYRVRNRTSLEKREPEGLAQGELVFMVRPSGSGKSTFLRLVLKEEAPTDGRIQWPAGGTSSDWSHWKVPVTCGGGSAASSGLSSCRTIERLSERRVSAPPPPSRSSESTGGFIRKGRSRGDDPWAGWEGKQRRICRRAVRWKSSSGVRWLAAFVQQRPMILLPTSDRNIDPATRSAS